MGKSKHNTSPRYDIKRVFYRSPDKASSLEFVSRAQRELGLNGSEVHRSKPTESPPNTLKLAFEGERDIYHYHGATVTWGFSRVGRGIRPALEFVAKDNANPYVNLFVQKIGLPWKNFKIKKVEG